MASKADMQIMSIASNLYLLDSYSPECNLDAILPGHRNNNNVIPDNYVSIAINFFNELLMGTQNYLEANGYIGNKEQIEAIINCFYDKNRIGVSLNQEKIKHKCEQLKVFKDLKNKRQLILSLLNELHKNNIILYENGMYFIIPIDATAIV